MFGPFHIRYLLAALPLLVTAPAIAAQKTFPVGDFDEILLVGIHDVKVRTGQKIAVSATGHADDLNMLDIRVEGRKLVISTKKNIGTYKFKDEVDVHVGVPSVKAATVAGSGDLDINGVRGNFTGRVNGSGDLGVQNMDAAKLDLAVTGSGDIEVKTGRCNTALLSAKGSGDIDISGVSCRDITADVIGSGDISGRASGTATLRIVGSGDISIVGGARCTTRKTGSGVATCS